VQSSRRLEREAARNVELMWLTGRLAPNHKTIATFRRDYGRALRQVCAQFVTLCRKLGLLNTASVAIDGSKFKAVNHRDKNFTRAKVERRRAQIAESVARYLQQLDTADRHEPTDALAARSTRLKEKIARLEQEMQRLAELEAQMLASPDQQISLTDPDARAMATSGRGSGVVGYNVPVAVETEHHPIVAHEVTNAGCDRAQLAAMGQEAKAVLEAVQRRLDLNPGAMRQRREVVEHPFGTIKMRMGATPFLMKRLPKVRGEMALHVLAYNLTRVLNILGIQPLMAALRAEEPGFACASTPLRRPTLAQRRWKPP
jgi:ribosomal protein L14E/L6E/L27E